MRETRSTSLRRSNHWGVVQRQDSGLLIRERGFESSLPSNSVILGRRGFEARSYTLAGYLSERRRLHFGMV
jgi:hypothetical protein